MRPEFDSEIDSVLRGHARRGGAQPAAWGGGLRPSISNEGASASSHLDADEIAAFGEGALPQAARARYSAHLADCDDCRRSVTQITLAAGVADRIEERERSVAAVTAAAAATESPSWRERLAAVFAPRAWRYAMPVVALLAVGVVVLIGTRGLRPEGAPEKAGNRGDAPQQVSAPAAPESHHAGAKQPPPAEQAGNTGAAAVGTATGEEQQSADAAEGVAKLGAKPADGLGQSATGGAVGSADRPGVIQQQPEAVTVSPVNQSYASAPQATPLPPAPAAAPRVTVLKDLELQAPPAPAEPEAKERTRADSRTESRAAAISRDEAAATKRHGPQRGSGGRSADLSSVAEAPKDDRAMSSRARGPQNNAQNNARNNARNDTDAAKAKREEDREQQRQEAETRSAGGRRFRREGGVWIDTAYRAGQATVVVRVNSEQYRALVADAPEIGRISRALGAEAVIVWKGRAYRVKP